MINVSCARIHRQVRRWTRRCGGLLGGQEGCENARGEVDAGAELEVIGAEGAMGKLLQGVRQDGGG